MTVSVVMATYNGARFVEAQLDSLLSQTRPPDELIISDDGSQDGTLDVARRALAFAPFPVRYTRNQGIRGYSANFVHAARLSTGDLVFFCDQDDIWWPDKILAVEAAFQRDTDVYCLTHDFAVSNANAERIPSYFDHLRRLGVSPRSCVKGCATAVSRRFLEVEGWVITGGWTYDKWVCFFSELLMRREIISEVLMDHRIHDNNTSGYLGPNANMSRKVLRCARRIAFPDAERGDVIARKALSVDELNALATHIERRYADDGSLSDIRDFIHRRRALLTFRNSQDYRRVTARVKGSIGHVRKHAYVADEIVVSLLNDLLGRNSVEGDSANLNS